MNEKDYEGREFDLAREEVLEELAIKYNESGKPCVSDEVWDKCNAYVNGFGEMTDEEQEAVLIYWAQRELDVAIELMAEGGKYSREEYAKRDTGMLLWNGQRDVTANTEDWMRRILDAVEQQTDAEAITYYEEA